MLLSSVMTLLLGVAVVSCRCVAIAFIVTIPITVVDPHRRSSPSMSPATAHHRPLLLPSHLHYCPLIVALLLLPFSIVSFLSLLPLFLNCHHCCCCRRQHRASAVLYLVCRKPQQVYFPFVRLPTKKHCSATNRTVVLVIVVVVV